MVEAIRDADWSDAEVAKAAVLAGVDDYLSSDRLRFLVELSLEPLAIQLGCVGDGAG